MKRHASPGSGGFIDEGALPRTEPKKIWARLSPGTGSCIGCGQALMKGDPEYEFTTAAAIIVVFHRQCFTQYIRLVSDGDRDGHGRVIHLSRSADANDPPPPSTPAASP